MLIFFLIHRGQRQGAESRARESEYNSQVLAGIKEMQVAQTGRQRSVLEVQVKQVNWLELRTDNLANWEGFWKGYI